MTGMSGPEEQVTQEKGGEAAAEGSRWPSRSIIGLSIISGLNVLCLAFVIFHFTGNADDPAAEAAQPSASGVLAGAERSQATVGVFGNIDFAPMPEHVVSIASGIEKTEGIVSGQQAKDRMSDARTTRSATRADPKEEGDPQSWVQLAALSNMDTAERVWSDLKKRHAALLSDRHARYFGPDDVGGSLYHVRLGPMGADAAKGLCDELEAEGADCYCIWPKPKSMS